MAEGQPSASGVSPVSNPMSKNHVPEMIRKIQAAKATGKFTFQAGRYVEPFVLQ